MLRAQRLAGLELKRRRQAEDALRLLNESLEQQVLQPTQELRDMVAGLESFSRSVSHDLRGRWARSQPGAGATFCFTLQALDARR